MNIHGIIICLQDSKNLNTIAERTNKLINNLHVQIEVRHPSNSTIGCFMAHIKALDYGIKIMQAKNLEYIIIGEEDLIIDYKSKHYINIIQCLSNYNKTSNYILHLGGFPTYTNSLRNIIKNNINNHVFISNVYLTTCYVVNIKIAKKLLNILKNSSYSIHCDAIFANSNIEQRLVKGNIINQLNDYNSTNTFLHNYINTDIITKFYLVINKFNILFILNIKQLLLSFIFLIFLKNIYKNENIDKNINNILLIEFIINIINYKKSLFIEYKYNKYLNKNIFTFLEFTKILRIITFKELINIIQNINEL